MKAHWRYLKYVIRHKWFVFVAGLRVGAPLWRLLIHDYSKFSPAEWRPYVLSFYGPWKYKDRPPHVVAAFDRAWLHHQHWNPHHWQHWVLREDSGTTVLLSMPKGLALEMVADWMGAGRAITGKWEAGVWYAQNRTKILLHPDTRRFVESYLRSHAGLIQVCHCGATGEWPENCDTHGYCAAHMTSVAAQKPPQLQETP